MVRLNADKVEIVFLYGECGRSFNATAKRFNEIYPDRPVDHRYVSRLITKFTETLSLEDRPRSGRPKTDEDTVLEVLGSVSVDCQKSLTQINKESNIPSTTIRRILKTNHFHPYKMHFTQELLVDDPDRRLEFCEKMCEKVIRDPHLLRHICFSDECTFFLNGKVNTQNVRFWCDSNPHLFTTTKSQYPQKINVWAGILGDNVIGPFFLTENLTGDLYFELLENVIDPKITEVIENTIYFPAEEVIHEEKVIFQQDGCPAHYKKNVRDYLDKNYPNKWIGRRGSFLEWPPRSPDLAPNDFFLWGYLKSIVYKTPPTSLDELKYRIKDGCSKITPQTFEAVRQDFLQRLYYCQEMEGNQFEYLLN